MRLVAVSVFFVTFAGTAWVAAPPPPGPGIEPVGPVTPAPVPPDLPPEPLDPADIACMNDIANDPRWAREFRVVALRQLLTHYLRPPADPARVAAVLRDTRWVAEADIKWPKNYALQGKPFPDGLDANIAPVFWVTAINGPDGWGVWWVARVSGKPDPTVDDFRAFLCGRPSPLRIEESGWVRRDLCGVEHYTPKGYYLR
jgi:hypothetical protein